MTTEKATNLVDMRTSNVLLIMNILRKEPCSRANIAKLTGLSRSAITIIVDDLLQRGIIEETSTSRNGTGRRALDLKLSSSAAYVVGVHLRSQKYSIGVFDFDGKLLRSIERDYEPVFVSASQLLKIGVEIINLVESEGIDSAKVLGVGICASGPVDVGAGKVTRLSSIWHEVEIVKILESTLPWKCFLENRSNARALYEKLYGICREISNFVYFKVDEAVGGAIIYRDEVLSGHRGFGNEFGHTTIKFDGEVCECGNIGCLDMYASIPSILKQFPGLNMSSWEEVVDAAYAGNSLAIQALKQEADYISAGVVNLCNIIEPEAIVLAGDITYRAGLLIALISESCSVRHILRNVYNPQILVSEQTDSINISSAAAIVIEEFYLGNIMFF